MNGQDLADAVEKSEHVILRRGYDYMRTLPDDAVELIVKALRHYYANVDKGTKT